MLKLITTIGLILLVSGCSKEAPQITASEKARLLSEQIIDNSRCGSLKNRLVSLSIEDDAIGTIDAIYHDAVKTSCINKDI